MNQQVLQIERLHCASLIEQTSACEPSRIECVRFPCSAEPIRIVRASEVLYFPSLRLQVLPGGIVPLEAILDSSILGFERARNFGGAADIFREPFHARQDPREVCILSNLYSANFGHWITEELAKVCVLEHSGFSGSYILHGQPDFSRELLECLGIPAGRVIEIGDEPTSFQSAVFVTPINVVTLLTYPDVFFLLRNKLLGARDPLTASPRRVWMHRGAQSNNGRELIDADEVYNLVALHGFEVVDMAARPVREQLAIANRADVIMGPHGAAFVHAMFMQAHSTVIECYSPEFINSEGFCPEICSLLRHRYFMLVHANAYGAYPYGQKLKINCFQLELLLQSLDL